jgi:hypothetical protein
LDSPGVEIGPVSIIIRKSKIGSLISNYLIQPFSMSGYDIHHSVQFIYRILISGLYRITYRAIVLSFNDK